MSVERENLALARVSQPSMRRLPLPVFVVLGHSLSACASTLPPSDSTPSDTVASSSRDSVEVTPSEDAVPTRSVVHAPGMTVEELIEGAGMASYLVDHDLRMASIDGAAMERWFTREPGAVFLYAERSIETGPETSVRGACQRLPRSSDVVTNGLTFVLTRSGRERVVLDVGQDHLDVDDQRLEERVWQTNGGRRLPVGLIAWDDAHIAFAEGAEVQEVACVNTVRHVLCTPEAHPWVGPRGYCHQRTLEVRPWRAPFVPHVGPVSPAYPDTYPPLPEGHCELECEPSACDDALARVTLPRVPLYTEQDPVLALFRTQAACRAYATSRGSAASGGGAW